MPIYEYYCDRCQEKYEAIRPVSRIDESAPCPDCGSEGKRQLSAFAFRDGKYGRFVTSDAPVVNPPKASDKSNN